MKDDNHEAISSKQNYPFFGDQGRYYSITNALFTFFVGNLLLNDLLDFLLLCCSPSKGSSISIVG